MEESFDRMWSSFMLDVVEEDIAVDDEEPWDVVADASEVEDDSM